MNEIENKKKTESYLLSSSFTALPLYGIVGPTVLYCIVLCCIVSHNNVVLYIHRCTHPHTSEGKIIKVIK